jgi:hypothetical protein
MFVIALLILVVVRILPAGARTLRVLRPQDGGDRAAAVLLLAVRGLPAERADWGRAMMSELDAARASRARWAFCLGCVRATVAMRARASLGGRRRDGDGVRVVVLVAAVAALALGGYGLVRYPLLRAGDGAWAAALVLPALLVGYVGCALGLSHGTGPAAAAARRHGLAGGILVGASWLLAMFPTASLKEWVFVPLAFAMLGPAGVAVLSVRASRDPKAATAAALWCGLVAGLLVFVIWVTATYLHDGRPFDPQLIRDFHASGARDLTTYAVGDDLGAALGMLLIIPTVALAFGSLAARLGRRGGANASGRPEDGRSIVA